MPDSKANFDPKINSPLKLMLVHKDAALAYAKACRALLAITGEPTKNCSQTITGMTTIRNDFYKAHKKELETMPDSKANFDPKTILAYMDASLANAKTCRDILVTLGAYTANYDQTIARMDAAHNAFYEAHKGELTK